MYNNGMKPMNIRKGNPRAGHASDNKAPESIASSTRYILRMIMLQVEILTCANIIKLSEQ
jgi:hypothetical protein